MDISNATKEQKASAAVAYLARNMGGAPETTKKHLTKLNVVNNEGMQLVKQMQDLQKQQQAIDSSIGEKIGAAKVLFELVGDMLTDEEIDKFAQLFDPSDLPKMNTQSADEGRLVDMAGSTAPKDPIPGGTK